MTCPWLHRQCPKPDCNQHVCRAFFPLKQPYIRENMLKICHEDGYEMECPRYEMGVRYRVDRKREALDMHCPFATNNECGKPKHWMCKGRNPPFKTYPVYDEEGGLVNEFKVLEDTCLSGKRELYQECPYFKQGLEQYGKTVEDVFNVENI